MSFEIVTTKVKNGGHRQPQDNRPWIWEIRLLVGKCSLVVVSSLESGHGDRCKFETAKEAQEYGEHWLRDQLRSLLKGEGR